MPDQDQRFCPECDRRFEVGEALLRCRNCGLLAHPACWVRGGGCPSPGHARDPEAVAFSPSPSPSRRSESVYASGVAGPGREVRTVPGPPPPVPAAAPASRQRSRYTVEPPRSVPAVPRGRSHSQMPSVYRGAGILAFWWVPVAVIVAAAVAGGVVLAGDRLLFNEDDPAAVVPPGTETATPEGAESTTPPATTTTGPTGPAGEETPTTAETPGTVGPDRPPEVGDTVVISGTDGCLNIRDGASLEGEVIACLADGTELRIVAGPIDSDGFRWMRVQTPAGEGWAADEFLQPL